MPEKNEPIEPSREQWLQAAAKSAPGGRIEALNWTTPEGLVIKPLYTAADTVGLPHADTWPGQTVDPRLPVYRAPRPDDRPDTEEETHR